MGALLVSLRSWQEIAGVAGLTHTSRPPDSNACS